MLASQLFNYSADNAAATQMGSHAGKHTARLVLSVNDRVGPWFNIHAQQLQHGAARCASDCPMLPT